MARLIYKATGEEVQKGDVLTDFRGIRQLLLIGESLRME